MKKIKLFPLMHNKYYPKHQTVSTLNPFIIHPIIFIKILFSLTQPCTVLSRIHETLSSRSQNSHTAKKSAFCRWYLLIGRLRRQEKGGSHWWRRTLKPPTEHPSNMPLRRIICFTYALTYCTTNSVHHQRVTITILCCDRTRP